MSLMFSVGDLTIRRVIEQEFAFVPALDFIPALSPEVLAENRQWLKAAGALDDTDTFIMAFQSYVVKTPHHTILIDSCIGNDKPCRLHLRPRQGRCRVFRRSHALAATDAVSGAVDQIRRRSGTSREDAPQFPRTLLRHRHALLHRALPLAIGRQDQTQGQRVRLRGGIAELR